MHAELEENQKSKEIQLILKSEGYEFIPDTLHHLARMNYLDLGDDNNAAMELPRIQWKERKALREERDWGMEGIDLEKFLSLFDLPAKHMKSAGYIYFNLMVFNSIHILGLLGCGT